MKLSFGIRTKLFIAIFLACALAVVAAMSLAYFRFQKTFNHYVHTQENHYLESLAHELGYSYQDWQGWEILRNQSKWRDLLRLTFRQSRLPPPPKPPAGIALPHHRRSLLHRMARRVVLLDQHQQYVQGMRFRNARPDDLKPIISGQQVVGYLGMYPHHRMEAGSVDAEFINEQRKTLFLVALFTLFSSFFIAFLLARQLVKPIQSLRNSTSELAAGNYASRIKVHTQDEMGQLSRDFNQLAESLQQHEKSRRQWIMDIAHELRTPLSILRGEIEAIQDGINQPDPQTVQSLHQEIIHLQRLVEDLYSLSMSDSGSLTYQKEQLDLRLLLQEILAQFSSSFKEHGLNLNTQLSTAPVYVQGDAQRLQQLFQNLLKNSLRYTDAPGELQVSLKAQQAIATIVFADSAPGVPDAALAKLFERLYRVESSRNRATGGAGIGLSICYNIIQAHGGVIQAGHSALGGLRITLTLPCQNDTI